MQLKSLVNVSTQFILYVQVEVYHHSLQTFHVLYCKCSIYWGGGVLRDPIAIARLSYRKHKYHVHGIQISFIFFQITGRNIQRKLTFNFSFILSFMQKCRTIELSDYRYESECKYKFFNMTHAWMSFS